MANQNMERLRWEPSGWVTPNGNILPAPEFHCTGKESRALGLGGLGVATMRNGVILGREYDPVAYMWSAYAIEDGVRKDITGKSAVYCHWHGVRMPEPYADCVAYKTEVLARIADEGRR